MTEPVLVDVGMTDFVEPSTQPPLAGCVVLSIGHTLPGLYCLAMLRDLGAEIVRVERAARAGEAKYAGLAASFPVRSLTAGTHSLAFDLKADGGRAALQRLSRAAAVVLEGFRPGVAQRLGVDYATLCESHPALVYASLSGYGQEGPASQRVGHDINYLAETGVLGLANPAGLPGATFADGLAGASAALNVVAALHAAARSGQGQHLDLAIVDGPLFLMATELEAFWKSGVARGPGDTHLTGRHPWYGVHATADGGAVALGAVEPVFHRALCGALGHPELAEGQYAEGDALDRSQAAFRDAFATRTRDQAMALFEGMEACASAVLSTPEVAASPLMVRAAREGSVRDEALVRSPVRLPLPPLGCERHGAELLARFAFSEAEIEALVRSGALASER
jgi:alpha-methylacyl-CoA racemase